MATKKKPTARAKTKRPPSQFWICVHPETKEPLDDVFLKKAWAKEHASIDPGRREVVGPYVLSERVRQR